VIDTTAPSGSGGDPATTCAGSQISAIPPARATSAPSSSSSRPRGPTAGRTSAPPTSPRRTRSRWSTTLVADGEYDLRAVVTDTTGNVANELLPGLPKTVDNTAGEWIDHLPRRRFVRRRQHHGHRECLRRACPAGIGCLGSPLRDQADRRGAFTVFGTQTTPDGRLDLQPVARDGALADGPADLQVVVTDVAGNETTSATHTINVDNLAPVVTLDDPGATVGSSIGLTASASPDTANVVFRYRAVGSAARAL
jgi:hypothetical protein